MIENSPLIFFSFTFAACFYIFKGSHVGAVFFLSGFYLMYAKLEEEHGLARHAMTIYERATKAVLPEEQFEVQL